MPGTKLNSMLKSTNQVERDMAMPLNCFTWFSFYVHSCSYEWLCKRWRSFLVVKEMLNLKIYENRAR